MKAFLGASRLQRVYYNATPGAWAGITISRSARGNQPLLACDIQFLKTPRQFSDLASPSALAKAVEFLTDRGYWDCPHTAFLPRESATWQMLCQALYRHAGAPSGYSSEIQWAASVGVIPKPIPQELSAESVRQALHRTVQRSAPSRTPEVHLHQALKELVPPSSGPLTREALARILYAFFQSPLSRTDRSQVQMDLLRRCISRNGDGELHLYFPDLTTHNAPGKPGDCCLLLFPNGKTMLLDTGVATSATIVLDMVRQCGLRRLDYLVISHPHSDHVGSAVDVIAYLRNIGGSVGEFWQGGVDCKDYLKTISHALDGTTTVRTLCQGDEISIGPVQLSLWNPAPETTAELLRQGTVQEKDCNNHSLAIKFSFGQSSYLTCGDLYADQELRLAQRFGPQLQADICKANHHGAYTSNCPQWLQTVNPAALVVDSDDIGNTFLAKRTASEGRRLFAMGLDGAILLSMDSRRNYRILTQKGPCPENEIFERISLD